MISEDSSPSRITVADAPRFAEADATAIAERLFGIGGVRRAAAERARSELPHHRHGRDAFRAEDRERLRGAGDPRPPEPRDGAPGEHAAPSSASRPVRPDDRRRGDGPSGWHADGARTSSVWWTSCRACRSRACDRTPPRCCAAWAGGSRRWTARWRRSRIPRCTARFTGTSRGAGDARAHLDLIR